MVNEWEQKWIEDIEYLRKNLVKNHKNLFFNTTIEIFNDSIEQLKSIINELDYDDVKVELSKVVASIRDAHTSIIFPVNKYIPIKFYWFEDGIYVVRAIKKYKDLLYKKIVAIEGIEIEEVIDKLSSIISFENEHFFKAQSMKYIQVAEILYGLRIIDSMDSMKISTNHGDFVLETVSSNELVYIQKALPIYARRAHENFWYEYLEEDKKLYIKYNSCREDSEYTLKEKMNEVIKFIEKNAIHKLTIDLRNNLGGDSTLIAPLLDYIKSNNEINKKENLQVIIGRETFSSGLLNAYEFKFQTNATLIGEPSGGKPNCYGEILKFTLPNSKFIVSYSTKYYKLIENDKVMALYPDKTIYEKIEDYLS